MSVVVISIHALREEGDASLHPHNSATLNFYPRPPRGGRRCITWCCRLQKKISIHALREEGDLEQGHSQPPG